MIDVTNPYYKQLDLLLDVLRAAGNENRFALKGGTAINLFFRDLPRLSVDIDLTYLPLENRSETLRGIQEGLNGIAKTVKEKLRGSEVIPGGKVEGFTTKLLVRKNTVLVKVEVSPILRGSVGGARSLAVMESVEAEFGFAEFQVLDWKDVYAGKICAALDRQHPRDFFDMKFVLEEDGLTKELVAVFMVYLISGDRPISEMLDPKKIDLHPIYESQFKGMSLVEVTLSEILDIRERLIRGIREALDDRQRRFLISFKTGEPDWSLLGYAEAERLPAVQWKLTNVKRMTASKRESSLASLRRLLES